MDNRHKGIPDNPDIMWITSGTYTGRKQHPHLPYQTRTRCMGVIRVTGNTGIPGYREYRLYRGLTDYQKHWGYPVTINGITGDTGINGVRSTGYSHPTSGRTYVDYWSEYVQPGIPGDFRGYRRYRGYQGTGLPDTGDTGVRSTGYSHPTSGRTYVNYGSEYVHPEVSVGYPGERTLSGTHRTVARKSCGNTQMNVLRHRMDWADPVRSQPSPANLDQPRPIPTDPGRVRPTPANSNRSRPPRPTLVQVSS